MRFQFLFSLSVLVILTSQTSCSDEAPPDLQGEIAKTALLDEKDFQDSLRAAYDSANVTGCFVFYNEQTGKWLLYDAASCNVPRIPASTFKIFNSLVALEFRAVKDEFEVLKWDGVKRSVNAWNANTDMYDAFKNSTLWFYQEMARRVGKKQMKLMMDRSDYGNADTSGPVDKFWLTGDLRISAKQQVDFLRRLKSEDLPFSKNTMTTVKTIMINEETPRYILRGKTGWAMEPGGATGWYIGYLQRGKNYFYFANCVQCTDTLNEKFGPCRTEISKMVLRNLRLIE